MKPKVAKASGAGTAAGVRPRAPKARIAVYPGSFDPLTNGHVDLIERGLTLCDRLIVAVVHNPRKTSLFTAEERVDLIRAVVGNRAAVEVDAFRGLLVDYCKRRGATFILRGLRAVSDFEYELQMANMNRKLCADVQTLFLMTGEDHFYVSSQLVREVASLGGSVAAHVPPVVLRRLRGKFGGAARV